MQTGLVERCRQIAESQRFQLFILAVIVANAVTLGLETYRGIERDHGDTLSLLNDVFLGVFVAEIAIRMLSFGRRPQDYFRDGWNVFDFVVIAAAFVPGVRENATLLRLARLLRVVRIVSIFPDLRFLIAGMVRSLPPIGSMAMLTALLIYIYGMLGWILFDETDPEHWANIGESMLSLFVVLTLESWPEIMEAVTAEHPTAWLFFVSYVLIASFLLINMLIAILINSLEEVRAMEKIEARLDKRRDELEESGAAADPGKRLAAIREALDELEDELHLGGQGGPAQKGRDGPRVMKRFRG